MKYFAAAICVFGLLAATASAQMNPGSCCTPGDSSTGIVKSLDVRLAVLDGDTFDVAGALGESPIMLFHIGSGAAADSTAQLVAVAAAENQHIVFLGVLCDTGHKTLDHVRALKLGFPVLLDPGGEKMAFCQQNVCTPGAAFVGMAGDIVMNASQVNKEVLDQGIKALYESGKVTDPVCGMTIDRTAAAGSAEYKGKTYYFCSANCHDLFVKNPGKYLKN